MQLGIDRRLLGIDTGVVWALIIALFVTAAIFGLQNGMRAENFEPESLRIFPRLFLFEDYPATLTFVLVLFLGLVPAIQRTAFALAAAFGARPLLVCALALSVFGLGALHVYHQHPLSMDEYAPYLQSQIFAAGRLHGEFRLDILDWLIWPEFQGRFIHASLQTGEIASAYWPGFALLLTPFMALGVPWLLNPCLGAAAIWVTHRLTIELTQSRRAAGAAMLFMLGSASFSIYSISFYSMTAHLVCNAIFALLLLTPTTKRCVVAGLVGGLALNLHNPVPHMLFAVPWIAWMAWRRDWRMLSALAIGYLPWITVGLAWHQFLHSLADGGRVAGSIGGVNPIVEAIRIFAGIFSVPSPVQLVDRVIELAKLWLWAAPGLILLTVAGYRMHRTDWRWKLLGASVLSTAVGYFFVPLDQGHGWGYRYLHSAWFVLPVLAGTVMAAPAVAGCQLREPLVRYGIGLGLIGMVVMTPLFAFQVHRFIGTHLDQVPEASRGTPRVLIISTAMGYYAQDLGQNDAFLRDPVIRLVSRGARRDADMMAAVFPEYLLLSRSHRGTVWGTETNDSGRAADDPRD